MGAVVRLPGRLIGCFVVCMQGFLPGFHQSVISITGLNPQPEHLQSSGCCRIEKKTFLTAMTESASEAIAANQQLPGLMTQTMSQAKIGAVGSQQVPGCVHNLVNRQ